jgi:hypothetical protein
VRTGREELSRPWTVLALCVPLHCAEDAMDGSEQSTAEFCDCVPWDKESLRDCETHMPLDRTTNNVNRSNFRMKDSKSCSSGNCRLPTFAILPNWEMQSCRLQPLSLVAKSTQQNTGKTVRRCPNYPSDDRHPNRTKDSFCACFLRGTHLQSLSGLETFIVTSETVLPVRFRRLRSEQDFLRIISD